MNSRLQLLYDKAYELFWTGPSFCDDTIPQLSAACPRYTDTEYREAFDSAVELGKCTATLCDEWYSHRYTASEAKAKIKERCPGFSEAAYQRAWNTARQFVSR